MKSGWYDYINQKLDFQHCPRIYKIYSFYLVSHKCITDSFITPKLPSYPKHIASHCSTTLFLTFFYLLSTQTLKLTAIYQKEKFACRITSPEKPPLQIQYQAIDSCKMLMSQVCKVHQGNSKPCFLRRNRWVIAILLMYVNSYWNRHQQSLDLNMDKHRSRAMVLDHIML